ncbi:FAD/FMN-containing dehydrogenase [Arthrobacter sp. PvP102]|uniref:D-arabinono-1,4-lactone oxidase n=1 Tax=unclassified Arthrobacter TaxID=235627 RepID=UPI001AE832EB|nr:MULTISPECIES: D-arabinono-1,4-lactone oxidase [unclassified Arthrobacter]MBP1233284.1 FAD/FMN-containing dehydrogenase [Arthrobacter sp. PvP103]MBP1238419.1 FAD/FMN-containing dehydrogenase [Arthrobacter sp. PvP102]
MPTKTQTTEFPAVPHEIHRQWSNWGGNQSATPAYTVRPRTDEEVLEVVRYAIKAGLPVRAVGAGHSFTPLVQTGGILLDLAGISGITGTDTERLRARARAGTAISDFGEPLWNAGLSLSNQGDIDKQAIAGALSTGTHGSGVELGSFSSALRWARLINGHGEIVEIGENDLRELKAAQVALGTLGILLEVELAVSPRYHLAEQITYPTWGETVANWDTDIASNRHYSFLWCQGEESAGLYELPTPAGESMINRSYTKRYNAVDLDESTDLSSAEGARRDRAYRIYAGGFMIPFHELEYYVPMERGREAVEALQDLIRTRHADQKYPIEVRWVKAENGYLSPFQGRNTTVLSVSGAPGTNYWPYLRDVDEMLQDFDARAHWGKIHFLTRERVAALYPGYEEFVAVRREFDPHGVFLNDHTRALLA